MDKVSIGCAFLTHGGSLSSGGWASLDGEEPFRFTELETLKARGSLWVVTSPEAAFLADFGESYPFLRHANFLPTPVTAIAQEVGTNEPSLSAQRVSEVLSRVANLAQSMAPRGASLSLNAHATLSAALQDLVAPALRHEDLPDVLLEAMPSMFKAPQPLQAPSAQDIAVRIPANRLRLSTIVLASAVPAGTWREVNIADFPKPASALSWAIGDQQPVICNVTIRGLLPKIKATAPLLRNLTQGVTRWMALPEIIALSRLVEMTPKRIFVAEQFVTAQASLRVPPPHFAAHAGASISAGLMAEAFMQAASSTSVPRRIGSEAEPSQVFSVRAAWLTATARSYMMQEALALAESNFSVIGFGSSHVLVTVNRRMLPQLRKCIAASNLLSYPTGLRAMEERVASLKESHEQLTAQGVS